MVQTVLKFNDFSVVYSVKEEKKRELSALLRLNLALYKNERFCLVGESGSGKSTLALSIPKLLPDKARVEGDVVFEGTNIYRIPMTELNKIRKNRIGYIFQDATGSLIPNLSVEKQLKNVFAFRMSINDNHILTDKIRESLTAVGLNDTRRILASYPSQLSGGMCQRIMICLALSSSPGLVIADEPTASLDVVTQLKVLDLIMELQIKQRFTLLLITHDLRIASNYSDRIGVMTGGELLEVNSTAAFFNAPQTLYAQLLIESAKKLSA